MGRIHVLDPAVADQIAAGEVVERPASVVKELLDNAVDAGARDVRLQLRGPLSLTLIDDGCGMAADDAVLAFSRFATSKLASADELHHIRTLGFRGEALAAIASVAKVRLITREAGAAVATEVRIDGGRVAHVGEVGAPPGTRIDVDELFFNVPARKKFLKADRTELAACEDVVLSAALAEPARSFQVLVDDKPTIDLRGAPPGAGLDHPLRVERAVRCLGKHTRPFLYPVEQRTELLRLSGYVVAPLETRRDLAGVRLSVNGRPVADKALVQAVRAAFRTLLEVGRQPIVALDIEIDPALVDVNVHPRKSEVRFADPRRVTGHVIATLSELLSRTPWLTGDERAGHGPKVLLLKDGSVDGTALPSWPSSSTSTTDLGHRDRVRAALARFDAHTGGASFAGGAPAAIAPTTSSTSGSLLAAAPRFQALKVLGQAGATFLVLEGPEGLVVIDQHAAHERVVFERLRARSAGADGVLPAQPLLLPLQVELLPKELATLDDERAGALLDRFGLVLERFGPSTALIKAVPPGLDAKKAQQMVRDALFELGERGSTGTLDDRVDAVCARLACHAAVRAGDTLTPEAIRALLADLDAIDLGAHCPHGRPVARTLRFAEMAGWFDR